MSDGCPAVAISKEPAPEDIMAYPPRSKHTGIMNYGPRPRRAGRGHV